MRIALILAYTALVASGAVVVAALFDSAALLVEHCRERRFP
jgi:hypothetical protein